MEAVAVWNFGMRRLNLFWFFLTGLGIFLSVLGFSNLTNRAISASEKFVLNNDTQRLLKSDLPLDSSLNPFQHSQPVVLPVHSGFNQWQLPVFNQRDGWLISVGYTGQRDGSMPLKMRFESVEQKKAGVVNRNDTLIPLVKLKRKEALTRHRVARPKLSAANKSTTEQNDSKEFMIQTRTGSSDIRQNYETITATAVASGLRATVYVDQRDRKVVSQDVADAIVRIMDDEIPARVIPRIGDVADTDGNGRLHIVMTQVLDRMADGKLSLDGFVRPSDFDPMGVLPVSHASDLIFLNSRVTEVDYLKSLLAHEFTHAVAATRRQSLENGSSTEEESWLEEGLAHLSERWMDGSWQNLGYRISAFYRSPEKSRLVVNDQVGLRSGRAHGHRGASFSFLNWCESEFGENLPAQLMDSQFSGVRNL
ncbi:MAG: Neutral metalloprotease precursor, partial [Planctomycetota bacterium]